MQNKYFIFISYILLNLTVLDCRVFADPCEVDFERDSLSPATQEYLNRIDTGALTDRTITAIELNKIANSSVPINPHGLIMPVAQPKLIASFRAFQLLLSDKALTEEWENVQSRARTLLKKLDYEVTKRKEVEKTTEVIFRLEVNDRQFEVASKDLDRTYNWEDARRMCKEKFWS